MTDDNVPESTLSAPSNATLTLLAQQLQSAMLGLALPGLYKDGRDAALATMDKIGAGRAELQCEAKRNATGFELVIWFASHGQRQRVTHLKLLDQPATGAAH